MPVTDRPSRPSPWAEHAAHAQAPAHSTNGLIALAFAAMVAISAFSLWINGVN